MAGSLQTVSCLVVLISMTTSWLAAALHQQSDTVAHMNIESGPDDLLKPSSRMRFKSVPVRKVHVISMNHLDVGYYAGRDNQTGLAVEVLNRYLNEYFVRAINISRSMVKGGYTERYIYTTHPWLVSLYIDCPNITLANIPLRCPSKAEVEDFKTAVKQGLIAWHAGPMNMQTDNMGSVLFEYGLDLSKNLDTYFGINRTHAVYSQRDVPGLTKAVISSLYYHGIKAISVGVNPGTAPPAVPSPFVWKFDEADENGVMFFQVKGGYPLNPGVDPAHPRGLAKEKCHSVEGLDEVLCFAFRTDNTGPPVDVQEVLGWYEILRAEFPGAELVASTFDNFMAAAEPFRSSMPVKTFEMGDTWIQGVASDPKKTAMYRAMERTWVYCLESGQCKNDDERIQKMLRYLIKLPEHTWGAHQFLDNKNWTNQELAAARAAPGVDNVYRRTETSWLEQRQFLDFALAALGDHPLATLVRTEWEELADVALPDLTGYDEAKVGEDIKCSKGIIFRVAMDGSLTRLYDPDSKTEWADESHPMAALSYDTYVEADFVNMAKLYNYEAGVGYDKPNVTQYAHPERKSWPIKVVKMYRRRDDPSCDVWVQASTTDKQTQTKYGAPESFYIHFQENEDTYNMGVDVTLLVVDKVTTRLPESISLNFFPLVKSGWNKSQGKGVKSHKQGEGQNNNQRQDGDLKWYLNKMGEAVDPCNVVLNGSQYVHGVATGVSFTDAGASGLFLATRDSPIVLIGTKERPASPFPVPLQPFQCADIRNVAFNVFNNIWNTNYIYYYPYKKEDASFKSRFSIFFT